MVRSIKKTFTLLEIMICILVISLAAGFLSFSLKDILKDYHFTRSFSDFKKNLEHFERLSILVQSDSKIIIEKKGSKFFYKAKIEDPAFPVIEEELVGNVKLTFNDQEVDSLIISLYANGFVKPTGLIEFHTKNGKIRAVNL